MMRRLPSIKIRVSPSAPDDDALDVAGDGMIVFVIRSKLVIVPSLPIVDDDDDSSHKPILIAGSRTTLQAKISADDILTLNLALNWTSCGSTVKPSATERIIMLMSTELLLPLIVVVGSSSINRDMSRTMRFATRNSSIVNRKDSQSNRGWTSQHSSSSTPSSNKVSDCPCPIMYAGNEEFANEDEGMRQLSSLLQLFVVSLLIDHPPREHPLLSWPASKLPLL